MSLSLSLSGRRKRGAESKILVIRFYLIFKQGGKLVLAKEVEASLSVGADITEGLCLQDHLVLINHNRRLVPSELVGVG